MSAQSAMARLFCRSLADAGVRDVVISPGSRSTPFVHAVLEEARLRAHVVIDERGAAFHALGRARVTGVPVALLCTSGSAPAHYHPAIVEAHEACIPLVVLTADRPLSLQHCGASQTVDQVRMFGEHARFYAELPPPSGEAGFRAARRLAVQAVHRAVDPTPGPVHVNLRADKPLEPHAAGTEDERRLVSAAERVGAEPATVAHARVAGPPAEAVRALAARIREAKRGIVVCGPSRLARRGPDADAVLALSRRTGYPLLAEATSQLRFTGPMRETLATCDALDRGLGARAQPDLIVQIGATPIGAGLDRWLAASPNAPRVVVDPYGWPDPHGTAAEIVRADVGVTLDAVLAELAEAEGPLVDPAFVSELRARDRAVWEAVRSVLADGGDRTEGAMTRALVESLPAGALLAVSNSLPVRHLDTWCPGAIADVHVYSQRGAAGIDGLVAGALGAAEAAGEPTALLIGDLALLHDLGSLEIARRARVPFVVVVLNNDGGRIFETLPVARCPETARTLDAWTTPHGLRFEHAAAMFGLGYARVTTGEALRAEVRDALARPGCTLLEAAVEPHAAAAERARLDRAMEPT